MKWGAQRRVWLIPVVVTIAVAVTGWWCNNEVRRAIEDQLEDELRSLITADVTALNIWIDNQLRFVSTLAAEDRIRELSTAVVQRAVQDGADQETLQSFEEVQVLNQYMGPRLREARMGFVVIDPEGVIIGAPMAGMLGDQLHDEALERFKTIFDDGEPVLLTPYQPPRRGGPGGGPGGGNRKFRAENGGQFSGPRGRPMGNEADGDDSIEARRRNNFPGFGPRPEGKEREFRPEGAEGRGRPGGPGGGGRGRRNRTIMAVAAPILNEAGEIVAAIGLMIQPEREFTRILSVARSGDTGETYAFDANGIMISQSRFEDSLLGLGLLEPGSNATSPLNLELRDPGGNLVSGFEPKDPKEEWALTRIVRSAVAGNGGIDISPFRDYRGVPVVGAWEWLPKYQFGVATKLDATEAFEPLRVLRLVFLILLLLSVLSGVGLFLFSYLNATLYRRMEDAALEAKELGQYTLEKKIGEGGMGLVYRARHALLRRDTAVKLLLPERADESSIKRFEREVQMTCRLAHPNTIQIFDYGHTPDGIFYYAMEYLDGINLRELIKMEGRLAEGRVIHILSQVCASLSEAHEAGLVHRDIKPANVLVCDRGGVPDMIKVLDFGLVKSYRDEDNTAFQTTQTFSITGTPQFIAPEAVSHPDQVDHRSDLYAVGALGYYLLTGDHVFRGDNAFDVMQQHLSTRPDSIAERIGAPIDSDLESIIMSCLRKRSEERPQSARKILEQLRACRTAAKWTAVEQTAWWALYRQRQRGQVESDAPKSSTILEPTLQINLGERN